jgi:hypothetical protein
MGTRIFYGFFVLFYVVYVCVCVFLEKGPQGKSEAQNYALAFRVFCCCLAEKACTQRAVLSLSKVKALNPCNMYQISCSGTLMTRITLKILQHARFCYPLFFSFGFLYANTYNICYEIRNKMLFK